MFHDMGLTEKYSSPNRRFEVDGANAARDFMKSYGVPERDVEDVWRRSGVPRAAIEKLADADAFHAFGADRRQGLWQVRGLGEAPLPLFAAADRADATALLQSAPPRHRDRGSGRRR